MNEELERYKAEAQQWQHRYNSDLGRQNALQRKIKELEDQLSQVSTPAPESMSQKEWDELQQDFPEIAKAVEAKLGTMTQSYEAKINQLQSQLNPIQELNEQTYISSQMGQLSAEFPDWQETAQSAEFQQWVNQQPVTVRELVQSNEAADAAYLIRTFKATTQPAPQMPQQKLSKSVRDNCNKRQRSGDAPRAVRAHRLRMISRRHLTTSLNDSGCDDARQKTNTGRASRHSSFLWRVSKSR